MDGAGQMLARAGGVMRASVASALQHMFLRWREDSGTPVLFHLVGEVMAREDGRMAGHVGPWLPTQLRHMTENEIRAYARNAGLAPEDAAPWADALIGSFEVGRALRDGRSIEQVLAARAEHHSLEPWLSLGFSPEEAVRLHEQGWRPHLVGPWVATGVPFDVAAGWALSRGGRRVFTPEEYLRYATAGLTPDDVRSGRRRSKVLVPTERKIVWGRWTNWYVVAGADALLKVVRRRGHQQRIREARDVTGLRSAVPVDALEGEVGALFDECWAYEFVPSPGDDGVPERPHGWLPSTLPRRLSTELAHPLDMLEAALPFDVSSLRRADDTGWSCLWRRPYDLVELGALARSHGFEMRCSHRLVARALGPRR